MPAVFPISFLTQYIHLNALRAGIVKSVKELNRYTRSGHSVIMGNIRHEWQDGDTILSCFGKKKKKAIEKADNIFLNLVKALLVPPCLQGGYQFRDHPVKVADYRDVGYREYGRGRVGVDGNDGL